MSDVPPGTAQVAQISFMILVLIGQPICLDFIGISSLQIGKDLLLSTLDKNSCDVTASAALSHSLPSGKCFATDSEHKFLCGQL